MQDDQTRARQHLLIQGFTLYTAEAVVALLLSGSTTLVDPDHAWATEFTPESWRLTDQLLGRVPDEIAQLFAGAAEQCRASGKTGALMCTQGTSLLMPLDVPSIRGARMRIEEAVILGKQPPTEKLEAFGDEAIAREAKRRGLIPKAEPVPEAS